MPSKLWRQSAPKKFVSLLLLSVFLLSGCTVNFNTKGAAINDAGGVFVSANHGDVWKHMVLMPTISGTPGSIIGVEVNRLYIDPSDNGAIYLASLNEGLFFTYNVTKGWSKAGGLPEATINDLAIDAKDKCTIYVASGNRLYRTEDCTRTWTDIYFDNNPGIQISAVAVDHYNNKNVYIGTSRGDIIKSSDRGQTWKAIQRLDDGVRKIVVSPTDSRVIFTASAKNGIYRFNADSFVNLDDLENYKNRFDGTNWTDLNGELKEFNLGINFKNLVVCPDDNSLFLATDKVLLKSLDNGRSWIKIKLITPEKDTLINDIAVNPKDSDEFYYVSDTAFFKTADGGNTWTSKQLATSRGGSSLIIDFQNPNIIYMGTKKIKK